LSIKAPLNPVNELGSVANAETMAVETKYASQRFFETKDMVGNPFSVRSAFGGKVIGRSKGAGVSK
jgi:hypothetical protein